MSDLHGKLCHDFRLFQRRPWRRKEYAFVVAIGPAEALDNWLSRKMLKRGDSIDQASVEKDPARGRVSVGPVGRVTRLLHAEEKRLHPPRAALCRRASVPRQRFADLVRRSWQNRVVEALPTTSICRHWNSLKS